VQKDIRRLPKTASETTHNCVIQATKFSKTKHFERPKKDKIERVLQHRTSESVKKPAKVAESMPNPKICVSLEETTVKAMVDEAARAGLHGADMVEVRFDRLYLTKPQATVVEDEEGNRTSTMPPVNDWAVADVSELEVAESIAALKEGISLPVVFAVRPVREGGHFPGNEEQRIEILEQAIGSSVAWIDLELSIDSKARKALTEAAKSASCKIIASQHDVEGTPSAEEIITMVSENGDSGDIFKYCSTVNDHQDALQIIDAANTLSTQESPLYSLMALGNGGDWARLHAPTLGQEMVYATMRDEFRLSDKGLVNVRDLQDAWRLLEY
jgi:3-dehydroquinate dehydratase type I